jgi:pyridoxal phosphate enzyme (YggS family)
VPDPVALRARLDGVRDRIARAARRAGRDPSSVRLLAVSKTFSADDVRAAAAAGQIDFGENKVQEAQRKIAETSDLPLRWHLIGHLQSNKARKAGGVFHAIHSVDDAALIAPIENAAAELGRSLELLVQVDLAGEATKFGLSPDSLLQVFEAGERCRAAHIAGLMLIPPAVDDPEEARPYFKRLRGLRDALMRQGIPPAALHELSMGMSHDFEVAIEEGATIVRVGTSIFGARSPRPA